jgi:uncharacterized membrane protein YeaQ/YmgE (transglycosylase-associated protein family)
MSFVATNGRGGNGKVDIASIGGCILVGIVVGVLARLLVPGRSRIGVLGTFAVGVLGAVGGGWLAGTVLPETTGVDWIASILVAVVLVLLPGIETPLPFTTEVSPGSIHGVGDLLGDAVRPAPSEGQDARGHPDDLSAGEDLGEAGEGSLVDVGDLREGRDDGAVGQVAVQIRDAVLLAGRRGIGDLPESQHLEGTPRRIARTSKQREVRGARLAVRIGRVVGDEQRDDAGTDVLGDPVDVTVR